MHFYIKLAALNLGTKMHKRRANRYIRLFLCVVSHITPSTAQLPHGIPDNEISHRTFRQRQYLQATGAREKNRRGIEGDVD